MLSNYFSLRPLLDHTTTLHALGVRCWFGECVELTTILGRTLVKALKRDIRGTDDRFL